MSLATITRFKLGSIILILLVGVIIGLLVSKLQTELQAPWLFLASAVVLLVSAWLMQRSVAVCNIRHLTIPAFWFFTYLVMIFFPAFGVYFDHPGPYRNGYLFAVVSVLVTVPLGVILANVAHGFHASEIKKYFEKPFTDRNDRGHEWVVSWLYLGVAGALVLLYLREVETPPLLYLMTHPGEFAVLSQLREESFKLIDSPLLFFYSLLRVIGFPFLAMFTLGQYLQTKKLSWLGMFCLSSVIGVIYSAISLAKGPVAHLVLGIFLFIYLYAAGKIRWRTIAISVVLILAFPIMVIFGTTYGTGIGMGEILGSIGKRLFYDPADVLYWYFELFPGDMGYLHGRTIGKLGMLMGWDFFDAPNYVGRYGLHSRIESVNANAAFIGNLNADFGFGGVIIGGIVAGFLMQAIQIYFLRSKKDVPNLAAVIVIMLAFWNLNSTSLPTVLLSQGVIIAIFLPWAIRTRLGMWKLITPGAKAQ